MILTRTPLQRPALNGAVVRPLLRGGLQAQPRSAMPSLPEPRAPLPVLPLVLLLLPRPS